MKRFALALVATTALATLPAFAQMVDFATADGNADGSVTMEEATAAGLTWTQEQFTAADTDGNGSLSQEEFEAAQQ